LSIQKNDGVPHYLRLAEYIIKKIKSGEFVVGDKIPSEMELSRQFGLNRHTVRQAIDRVAKLGWLTTIKGKGTYVKFKPTVVSYTISDKTCFTDNMKRIDRKHKSLLLGWEKDNPMREEAQALQLASDEQVYRLEILRYVNGTPFSITTSVLPEKAVPLIEQYLENFYSLYAILENHYNFTPVRVRSVFQATFAEVKDITYLEMPEGVPILKIKSLMCHPAGYPVEYDVIRIRGDMSECHIEFKGGDLRGIWE